MSGTARLVALLRDNVFPLLIGLVGAAGLVAAIGGITMWSRFFAAELPPEQATDAVADPELIVIGAVALILFALSGLLIVTFAYVVDQGGRQTKETAWTLLMVAVLGGLAVCVAAEENGEQALIAAAVVIVLGAGAGFVLWFFDKDRGKEDSEREERVPPAAHEASDPWDRTRDRPPPRFLLTPAGRFVLAGLAIVCAGSVGLLLDKGSEQGLFLWAIAVLLAVALVWGCYGVAHSTGGTFVWFGLSLFISVLLFGTYLALGDVLLHQRLQPVAVIRDNDRAGQGVAGFYVAETSDRLYLATVAMGCDETRIRKDSGRLFWISRGEIRAMSIGPQQDPDQIVDVPAEMLRELWAARIPLGASPQKADTGTDRVGKAPEPDDELDAGDSPRAVDDLPEPAPAVLRAPKIHSMTVTNRKGQHPSRARPGDVVTVKGTEFGANPTVTVDDVRVGSLLEPLPDPHGNSELKFEVPRLAESGRVQVRCGEVSPTTLAVVPRPVPVAVNVRRLGADRVRLAAQPGRDRGELRYRWRIRRRDKRQRVIVERITAGRPLRVRLTLLDDEGSRGTKVVSVRLRDGQLVKDERRPRR